MSSTKKSYFLLLFIPLLSSGCSALIRSVFLKSSAQISTPAEPHTFPCGDGTLGNPWCVADYEDLKLIESHSGDYFTQTSATIDAGGCSTPFTPITNFTGSYNGNNGIITNLCSTDSAGFAKHASVAAVIQNVQFTNLQVTGSGTSFTINSVPMNVVGGVIGWVEDSVTLDQVTVSGSVDGTGADATGSIAGVASGWSPYISNVVSSASIAGTNYVGSIGYLADGAQLTTSHSSGDVTGANYVGSLIGAMEAGTSLSDSYATGNVTANNYVGGLVGRALAIYANNLYSTGDVSGNDYVGGLFGVVGDAVNINASASHTNTVSGRDYVGGFVGASYGVNTSNSYSGINYSSAATTVIGRNHVGGFIGSMYDPSNSEVMYTYYTYAQGSVTSTGSFVGGYVGSMGSGSQANNSFETGSVITTGGNVGGFAGVIFDNGSSGMSNAFATGNVSTTGDFVGGFVGKMLDGSITSAFSSGHVSGGAFTGGFAGSIAGSVILTYSMSTQVSGSTPASRGGYAGGITGSVMWAVYYYDGGVSIPLDPMITYMNNTSFAWSNVSNVNNYYSLGFNVDLKSRDPAASGSTGDLTKFPVQDWSCDTGTTINGASLSSITGFVCY